MTEIGYLLEVEGRNKSSDLVETFYWSTHEISPFPPDDPDRPNQLYDSVVKDPGSYGRRVFSDGRTIGEPQSENGGPLISNADGAFSSLRSTHAFDGQEIRIYRGYVNSQNWSDYSLFTKALMEHPFFTFAKNQAPQMEIELRDRSVAFRSLEFQPNKYLGTNSGPTGVEGTEDDIKNQPVVKSYGYNSNYSAVLVNSSDLTFQLNDGPINAIDSVFDSGAELDSSKTYVTDYATVALLQASSPNSASYNTCLAEGYFKLGASPSGAITCDFEGDKYGGTYVETVSDIVKRILVEELGFSASDYVSSEFTTLNTDNSMPVGIVVDEETNFSEVVTTLCSYIGAAWWFDLQGVFHIKVFSDPSSGTSIADVYDEDVLDVVRLPISGDDRGLPIYRVDLGYSRNLTVQNESDVAGIAYSRLAYLKNEYRVVSSAEDSAVKADHLHSQTIRRNTNIKLESDAQTEANRLGSLYSPLRDLLEITVFLDEDTESWDLMDVITLYLPELGYPNGKKGVILDASENNPSVNRRTFQVWI